jgi:hypothetical protein
MPDSGGEFRQGSKIGMAFIDGFNFLSKPVQYIVLDAMAIVEGDIILGSVETVERSFEMLQAELAGRPFEKAIVKIPGSQLGWPNCRIPYQINADLLNQDRVTDAIAHWEQNTDFHFVLRTSNNEEHFPDFVEFIPGSRCWSSVGRQSGRQIVILDDGCTTGSCIHEIGHVAGLWHEHSREDRDAFVTIIWENIIPEKVSNFTQHITDGDDVGSYDYGSIMHYPRWAFSANGQDTIVPTDPNAQIGQSEELSAGDIRAVEMVLCPTVPDITDLGTGPAVQRLLERGLVPKLSGEHGPGEWVWRQSPTAGTRVDRGSIVHLRIRPGPRP